MRLAYVFLFSACTVLTASAARAVTAIDVASVVRAAADGATPYACSNRLNVPGCVVDGTAQGVGGQDCRDDTELSISLTVQGVPDASGTLQVWAGPTDCSQPGATNNTTTATCWPVAAPPVTAAVMVVKVRVADLVASIGLSSPPQTYQSTAAAQACANASASSEATLGVHVLWFPNGQTTPTVASAPIPVKVKLGAPGPCTNVTATSASDSSLAISWAPPAGDTTLAGFDLFAQAADACGDAAALDTSKVAAVVAGATSTMGTIPGLSSQTSYATGVAAVDEFGNVGDVAPSAACATPGNDLVKGSCGCSTVGASSGGAGFLAIGALLFVASRRRRTDSKRVAP